MKRTKIIAILLTALFALPVHAQLQKAAANALLKSGTEQTAKQTIRVGAEQLIAPGVTSSLVVGGTGQVPATLSTTPLPPALPPAAVKESAATTAGNKLHTIDPNVIRGKITAAEQFHQTDAFIERAQNTLNFLIKDFLPAHNNRFPEQHFGEDISGMSAEQIQDLALESNLRQQIDAIITANPTHPIAKEFIALYNDLAEASLDKAIHVFKEISPFNLFTIPEQAPVSFAQPIALESEELPNAYQLTENFYRGGQPTEEGYRILAKRGVKTIISFRTHKPNKQLIESLGMESVHIPLNPALITPAQMTRFLQLVADPTHQPVYVHCRYGSDRTGTMVAMYRMVMQKWPKANTLKEMKNPQFGFHKLFFTLPPIVKHTNVGKIEAKLQK